MKKTAIITGGSRGIGFGIVMKLGEDGFNVVITGTKSEENCTENLNILSNKGISFLYVQGDVSTTNDRDMLISKTLSEFGDIHVLVNNAGVAPAERNDLLEMTEESFDRVIGINTKGAMFLTQAVAKQMIKQDYIGKKRGTIINISSCSAATSSISRGEYCVSKAGMSMLTLLYADRLAKEGIFVHEVRPGIISTDMTSAVQEKYDKMIGDGVFPIARWGTVEDVANVVSVFASDLFLYTTGNYIDIDGGFHIKRL
ncbi:MAG: 3-ketoacyl-ACP reductase [Oscillospiraceae bacterium]|jgi:NAD(P)-dependent dehydrogenase (short-subunit alcohol dehydrogenase family)|nr:3-ketoacyl-ACP reductase [Oscillospiraceae bacterium]